MANLAGYKHEPLTDSKNEIRLLWQHRPRQLKAPLSFEISTWNVNETLPEFRAVSYTWGTGTGRARHISINGQRFRVGSNCFYALWQVTNALRDEYIWIDAVCIDQSNAEERSHQVAMMYELYRRATGVIACIGPADDNSAWFAATACILNQFMNKMDDDDATFIGNERLERIAMALARAIDERESGRLSRAMADFQAREYWARLWIVQEFSAARDFAVHIFCGTTSIPSVALALLYKCFNAEEHLTRFHSQFTWDLHMGAVLNAVAGDSDRFVRPYTLLGVIYQFSDFHCTDPRDRLFGMLWLVNFIFHPHGRFEPDYTWSRWKLVAQALARLMTCSLYHPLLLFEAFSVKPSDRHGATIEREQDLLTTKGRSEQACSSELRFWKFSQKTQVLRLQHFTLQSELLSPRNALDTSHRNEEEGMIISKTICDIFKTKDSADSNDHDLILYASPGLCQRASPRDVVIPIDLHQYTPKSGRFVPFLVVGGEELEEEGHYSLRGIVLGHPCIAASYNTICNQSDGQSCIPANSGQAEAAVLLTVDAAMWIMARISELDDADADEFDKEAPFLVDLVVPDVAVVRLRGHTII